MPCLAERIGCLVTKADVAPCGNIFGNDLLQSDTVAESSCTDTLHTTRDGNFGNIDAAIECTCANVLRAVLHGDGFQSDATGKSMCTDILHILRDNKILYLRILVAVKMPCLAERIGCLVTKADVTPCWDIFGNDLLQ